MEATYDTSDYREFLRVFGAGQEDIYRKFKDLKNDLNIYVKNAIFIPFLGQKNKKFREIYNI